MQDLRGEPEELFRKTESSLAECISFGLEVLLSRSGIDAFGTKYDTPAQRLRYELKLGLAHGTNGAPKGVVVREERCYPISRKDDRATYLPNAGVSYNSRVNPFIKLNDQGDAILIRQDGRQKHGRPVQLSLKEASRTALSTITTAEFPHLYALREILANMRFLEINPRAARNANDKFEIRTLRPDASNLSAVLARLKEETATAERPNGVLSDIAADLASLIPSVRELDVQAGQNQRQYSFSLRFAGELKFSSRVISDGTLRLLALLTVLNDPERRGTLCFEEPENGVHEGRVPMLIDFLRNATQLASNSEGAVAFQILLNTHSPKVMAALRDEEIVAADSVAKIDPVTGIRSTRTRMRVGMSAQPDLLDPETHLSRFEVTSLLQRANDAA
jgi:predicted ATPase